MTTHYIRDKGPEEEVSESEVEDQILFQGYDMESETEESEDSEKDWPLEVTPFTDKEEKEVNRVELHTLGRLDQGCLR